MHNHLKIEIDAADFRKKLNIKDGAKGDPGKSIEGPPGPKGEPGKSVKGDPGKDGSPDTPDEVVDKVNSSKKKIKAKQIEGLSTLMKEVDDRGKHPVGKDAGGGPKYVFRSNGTVISDHVTEIDYTTGITAVYSGNGRITLSVSSGVGAWKTPVESVAADGSVVQFTVGSTPPTDVVSDAGTFFNGFGYTFAAGKITMDNGPTQFIRYR